MARQPTKRFKRIAETGVSLGALAIIALAVNPLVFQSSVLENVAQLVLLFLANLVLSLPARQLMKRSGSKPEANRIAGAIIFVSLAIVLLFVDNTLIGIITDDASSPLASAVATILTAAVWLAAFVSAWKPFLQNPRNRFISSAVSLGLVCIASTLYFGSLLISAVGDNAGQFVDFIRFALACISLSSAISAFIIQWDIRMEKVRQEKAESIGTADIQIRPFNPKENLVEAEALVSSSITLEEFADHSLESWAYARDFLCQILARSTNLYGAYVEDELVGLALVEIRGASKPYARSRYALFHWGFCKWERIMGRDDENARDAALRADLLSELDPTPDAELLLIATSPLMKGKGAGSKLLDSVGADLAGRSLFLYADDSTDCAFFEARGFREVAQRTMVEESPEGTSEVSYRIYVK